MLLNACLLGVLLWQSHYLWRRVRRARPYNDALLERVNLEALRQTGSAELNSSDQILQGGNRNSTRKYPLWSTAADLQAHVDAPPLAHGTMGNQGINKSHVATQRMSNTSRVRRRVHIVNGTSDRPGIFWDGPHKNTYLSGLASSLEYATAAEAKQTCVELNLESKDQRRCGGITHFRGTWTLRSGSHTRTSPLGETSLILRKEVKISSTDTGTSVMHTTANTKKRQNAKSKPVLMCFCFDNELDLLHIKFEMYHQVVTKFIISESRFSGRGLPKPTTLANHIHEPRWALYRPQIVHIVDEVEPKHTGKKLGWAQTAHVKKVLGDYLIQNQTFSSMYDNGIVLLSDMDELPSVEQVIWLANNCCEPRQTIVVDMPYYVYGVHWLSWGISTTTLSARNLKDEIDFWTAKKTGQSFQQKIRRIPQDIKDLVHGIHCSYCGTTLQNVQKLQHTNVVDGPPFLGEFYWDENIFAMLKGCGIAPNGDTLHENQNNLDHIAFAEFDHYQYLKQDLVPVCSPAEVPESRWEEIFPALKKIPKLKWKRMRQANKTGS